MQTLAELSGSIVGGELAVVIPAYKRRFLDKALASLAQQTDPNFCVYVGDDASPEDLAAVVSRWSSRLKLQYVRFEQNLGATSLTRQWARCVSLSQEPWVWLLGDDDEAEPGCIAAWREARAAAPDADLFHFDVDRIDADGALLEREASFPARMSSRQFLEKRLLRQLNSYAPDYVFRRAAWLRVGGFQEFPLAWCSDDATWAKMAASGGICAVRGPRLRWRFSGYNISSTNGQVGAQKMRASVEYVRWLQGFLTSLPTDAQDPRDEVLLKAARWWLFDQAYWTETRFGWAGAFKLASELRGMPGFSALSLVLRALQADRRLRGHRGTQVKRRAAPP